MLSTWYPFILFAAVIFIGVPLWCWLAGDDDPGNETVHEQERAAQASRDGLGRFSRDTRCVWC